MSHSLDTLDIPVTAAGRTLDDTDRQIVTFLQRDARMANAEIARRLGMAPSAIFDRIRKLEERRGVVGQFELATSFRFGGTPGDLSESGLRLYAKEVLPVVRSW